MPVINNAVPYGPTWLHRRETGIRPVLGSAGLQTRCYYENINCREIYNMESGIFCLEFNPKGSLLVAACENNSLLFFDPLNPKLVRTVENAHEDCVNSVKFLDSYAFATCSDDFSVALWDIRNLDRRVGHLLGHTNWVKSIDYAQQSKTLVTSGFDGSVIGWDLSQPLLDRVTDTALPQPSKLFSMNGLMRSRMSPDGSKLILSTTAGYLIVIHNLDLLHMAEDLKHLKPNMYRLMQLSQQCLMSSNESTDLFKGPGKRNRVEFICDFPDRNDAEVISSIQVHPEGHSVLSRYTSHEEISEWTCVHSIEENIKDDPSLEDPWKLPRTIHKSTPPSNVVRGLLDQHTTAGEMSDLTCNPSDVWEAVVAIADARARQAHDTAPRRLRPTLAEVVNQASGEGVEWRYVRFSRGIPVPSTTNFRLRGLRTGYEGNVTARRLVRAAFSFNMTPGPYRGEVVVPLSVYRRPSGERGTSLRRHTVAELRIENRMNGHIEEGLSQSQSASSSDSEDANDPSEEDPNLSIPLSVQCRWEEPTAGSSQASSPRSTPYRNPLIPQNIRRLHYVIQEPNVVRGFIKEPSFSIDGRVICSPYKVGVRLLAFTPDLKLPWQSPPESRPASLQVKWQHEIKPASITDAVVSTKMSPLDNQIFAGTLSGKIFVMSPFR